MSEDKKNTLEKLQSDIIKVSGRLKRLLDPIHMTPIELVVRDSKTLISLVTKYFNQK